MKRDNNRLPVYLSCLFFQPADDLPVPHVHAIESADGNDGISEWRQGFYITVYLHKRAAKLKNQKPFGNLW
jgi:hypothetical protein